MKKLLFFVIVLFFTSGATVFAANVPLMEKEELQPLLGSKDVVVLDVRTGRDWSQSEFKIKGAVRASYSTFNEWGNAYSKDTTLVLYCS